MPVTTYPRSSDRCEECTSRAMPVTPYPRSSETVTVHCSHEGNCTCTVSPEYAKNMHANLDEVCSGIDVPARTASLETSEEESSWIASLVCAEN